MKKTLSATQKAAALAGSAAAIAAPIADAKIVPANGDPGPLSAVVPDRRQATTGMWTAGEIPCVGERREF